MPAARWGIGPAGDAASSHDDLVAEPVRLVTVVLEVRDLDRAVGLYRDGFGLDLHPSDHEGGEHGGDDRWISGRHAATTWTDGAFLHFALYESKGEHTSGAQVSFRVDDLDLAHQRAVAGLQQMGAESVLFRRRTEICAMRRPVGDPRTIRHPDRAHRHVESR